MINFVCLCILQDFVRLPCQNQSSQTSNPSLVGAPTSVSGGFSEGYGSASGQLNSGLYPSVGSTGISAVADSIDLGPKDLDAGPAKQLRCCFILLSFLLWIFLIRLLIYIYT